MDNKDIDIKYFREKIVRLINQLENEESSGEEGTRTVELDQSRFGRLSRMDALQSQAMAVESKRRRNLLIQRLKSALSRIDEDEFGVCIRCGENINQERLEIDPAATMCFDCASEI